MRREEKVNTMSLARSSASWKSGDGVSDQFPAVLRVLVVDDDTTCLRILEKMLTTCLYEVTKCSRAEVALKTLRDNKDGFDIVISDVHMPDMDGFKLLEHIGLEMNLPVIMMSADDSKKVVMKGVTHGACDYLIKPPHMKNIWQHVVRRKRHEWEDKDNEQSEDDVECGSSGNEEDDKGGEDRDDSSSSKKPRVVWSTELHQQFVTAVNQLGIDKAVPKKILELMNVPGITRENVASRLQKYRQYLKKLSGQQQNGLGNSFFARHDPIFGSLSGLDYRPFSSSVQNLATNKPLMSTVGPGNPRNIFNFGNNPKIRFVEGQQLHSNNNKRVNLLKGIPTTMEPRVYGNMDMPLHARSTPLQTQMIQQQPPRTQFLNDVTSHIPSAVFGQNGISAAPAAYASSDFSTNQGIIDHLPRTMFSNSGIELSPEMNGSRGFVPNYDVYNDLNQNNRTDDWGMLQSVGSNFEHLNSCNGDDLSRMKSPEMGFQNGLYLDHQFGGEDSSCGSSPPNNEAGSRKDKEDEGSCKSSKKRKAEDDVDDDDEGEEQERDDSSSSKTTRVVWTVEMHRQFIHAVNQLGIDEAVPKEILELMNVPGLKEENVASHLQKYRCYLKRLSWLQEKGLVDSFIAANKTLISSVGPGYHPTNIQNHPEVNLVPTNYMEPNKNTMPSQQQFLNHVTLNIPSGAYETPKNIRFVEGRQQHNNNNNNNWRVNLLHGIVLVVWAIVVWLTLVRF